MADMHRATGSKRIAIYERTPEMWRSLCVRAKSSWTGGPSVSTGSRLQSRSGAAAMAAQREPLLLQVRALGNPQAAEDLDARAREEARLAGLERFLR